MIKCWGGNVVKVNKVSETKGMRGIHSEVEVEQLYS
jgi:hypothetical protein